MTAQTLPEKPETTARIRLSAAPSAVTESVFIVRVDGSVDTLTSDELDVVISALAKQGRHRLVIDLAGTQYISSAGWGIFISRLRELREHGGDLFLARMTEPVRDVYDLLELDGVLRSFDRLENAESHFTGGTANQSAVVATRRRLDPNVIREHADVTPPAPASLEDALRALIVEDPFYSAAELRARLTEIGSFKAGRLTVLTTLWRMNLAFKHQRFRYYRRQTPRPTPLR